jgi:hypothetical protein
MDEQLVGTLNFENYRADIFSTSAPGEFRVVYLDASGKTVEVAPLTGISTYHQRESEIVEHMRELKALGNKAPRSDLGDPGEY